jgi:cytochrome c553
VGDGRQLAAGAQAYARDCSGCHGPEGEGNGVTLVPRLAGQHYRYLLRQLHDTLEERRPNMPPPHIQLLSPYGVDELTGVADYLSRLKPSRRVLPDR